jgi:hypothetical protein
VNLLWTAEVGLFSLLAVDMLRWGVATLAIKAREIRISLLRGAPSHPAISRAATQARALPCPTSRTWIRTKMRVYR